MLYRNKFNRTIRKCSSDIILFHSLFSSGRYKNEFTFYNCTSSPHLSLPFPGAIGFSCDYSILDRLEQCPRTAEFSPSHLSPPVRERNVGRCPATRYYNRILPRISRRVRGLSLLPGASTYYRNNRSCPDRLYDKTILCRDKCGTDFFRFQEETKKFEFLIKIIYIKISIQMYKICII